MRATEKQRAYIASLIENSGDEYQTIETIWKATPKNNDKYPNEKADYRRLILSDNLEQLTFDDADYIISWFKGSYDKYKRKLRTKKVFEILINLNLV